MNSQGTPSWSPSSENVATQSELRASANYGYGLAPVPVKQPDAESLAYFQRLSDTQVQKEFEAERRKTILDGIDAKSRADLALAETHNRHAYLMALTSRPQAAPVSSHSTLAWLKHPVVLMAIAAVLPVLLERLFGYRRSAPNPVQRRHKPKARKVQKFYRKRSRMARLAYQD